ncbi:MAG: alpha-2-macroglobulin family protein, partial [Luteimonas sp.]
MASSAADSSERAPPRAAWTERAGDALIGRIHWQPPRWFAALRASLRVSPMHWLSGAFVAVAALLWWHSRPEPVIAPGALTVELTAPARTDYTQTPPKLAPLRLRFSGSAAPLEAVGKVPDGIEMTPAQPGAWQWTDDRTLVFTPAKDWPVGTEYTVRIDAATAIAPGVPLVQHTWTFGSAAFAATLDSAEFYQDPEDPALKKAVYALTFSHPVDSASLETRIAFTYTDGAGRALPAPASSFVYDERRLKAWVHSAPLVLPDNGGKLKLEIAAGISSTLGGKGNADKLNAVVALPSLYNVSVSAITPTLVDNDRYEPEQVLVVEFNQALRDADVSRAAQAWLLPADNPRTPANLRNGAYAWSQSDIDDAVLNASPPVVLRPSPAEREFVETHSFKYSAPPNRYLYVRIAKGLKSFGGFLLGEPATGIAQVPAYPELLRFVGDGALLSLKGERRVSIAARNVPGLRLEVARVLPGALHQLVQNSDGNYANPSFYALSEDSLVEREETRLTFARGDPTRAHYEGVDLGRFLGDGRRGVFLLSLRRLDADDAKKPAQQTLKEGSGEETDRRLVVLTDLGVLVKRALDGSRDVFVQSIADGTPVNGARVRAIARNGETLVSA